MLTAKSDTVDIVVGLESGADDYVVKPFKPKELVARIRARLRKFEEAAPESLEIGDLVIDVAGHTVKRDDETLSLTPLEFDLLVCLARKPWQVFTREVLLEQVWGYRHAADTRLVNVHVQRLRSKVEIDPENPRSCSRSAASATRPARRWHTPRSRMTVDAATESRSRRCQAETARAGPPDRVGRLAAAPSAVLATRPRELVRLLATVDPGPGRDRDRSPSRRCCRSWPAGSCSARSPTVCSTASEQAAIAQAAAGRRHGSVRRSTAPRSPTPLDVGPRAQRTGRDCWRRATRRATTTPSHHRPDARAADSAGHGGSLVLRRHRSPDESLPADLIDARSPDEPGTCYAYTPRRTTTTRRSPTPGTRRRDRSLIVPSTGADLRRSSTSSR